MYKLNEDPEYNPEDRMMAFTRACEWGEKIPTGILYKANRPTLNEQELAIKDKALVKQQVDPASFSGLLETFR